MNIETIINKILRQAALTPNHIALVSDNARFTDQELVAQGGNLACRP